MQVQTYQDIQVSVVRFTTQPGILVQQAMNLTMKKRLTQSNELEPVSQKTLRFLMQAEHTSLLEHVSATLTLEGISRSCLAQITRHRMSSFTSASQHYADYRDMPMVVGPEMASNDFCKQSLSTCITDYEDGVDTFGWKPEEARQLLPNASAVNLIWTVNMRSLANFFRLRSCRRNVEEMQVLADKVRKAIHPYWPEFIPVCGASCYTDGKCNQGRMSCSIPFKPYSGD